MLDLANELQNGSNQIKRNTMYPNTPPDFVICTNMFNDKRYNGETEKHQIGSSWEVLMQQVFRLGDNKTQFCIIPATEHNAVFDKSTISSFFQKYKANPFFYEPSTMSGRAVQSGPADLSFIVKGVENNDPVFQSTLQEI